MTNDDEAYADARNSSQAHGHSSQARRVEAGNNAMALMIMLTSLVDKDKLRITDDYR